MSLAERWAPAFIVAAVFAVFYGFMPPAKFLQWDDAQTLLSDPLWQGLSWSNLKWMWRSSHYGPWQPLSWLSWAVDFKLWGLDPEAFRRTNIVLHALTAGFFYAACLRLLPRGGYSILSATGAALFFALHPLRVESVIWITERRDVLSGLFAVVSVYLWLEDRRRWSALAFVGAVLAKGTALAVVPFIFFIEVFLRRLPVRQAFAVMLPHVAVALFAAYKNLQSLYGGAVPSLGLGLADRLLIAMSGSWFYLAKTVWPAGLSPYYALPMSEVDMRWGALPGAFLAACITVLCFHRKVRAWAVPVWFAYLIALAPVSGLFQNGRQAAADRYSYLACMPFAVLFGFGLGQLEHRRRRAALGVLTLVVLGLATATARQAGIWRDDITLWTRAVKVAPDAYLPNSNLAVALLVDNRSEEAIPYLEASIRIEPRDAKARVNLASLLAQKGDYAAALRLFQEAVALAPGDAAFAAARFNLGLLLIRAGRKDDGLAHLREAVRLNPSLGRRLPR